MGRPGILRRIPPAAWFFALLGAAWGLERWRALPLGDVPSEARLAGAVALVATLAAFGVLLDSAWYLIGAVLLALVLDRLVVREQERRLGELFGEAYAEYRARVRRWL